MSKASDSGKAFLAGVLAKLPAEQRAQAEALFNSADATGALEVIGTGTLGQSEINRQMDELRTQRESLTSLQDQNQTWFTENKAALEEYLQIKPEFDKLKGNPTPPLKSTAEGPTKEEIAAAFESNNRAFAGALSLGMDLSSRHLHTFSEPLNMTELLGDPKLGTVLDKNTGRVYGLQDAYDTKHGDRVRTKATEAEAARIKKLVDEGVAERLRATPQNHPFPLRDATPSPLDALQATDRKPADYTVDSAIAEYDRLSQTRSGSPA